MCILSLDSSTLPSASMTPGKVRRAPGRAGELSAAILLWRQTPARRLSGELASSSAICRALPPPSILRACSFTLRAGEGDLLWRAATTEPRRANKRSSFDRLFFRGFKAATTGSLQRAGLIQDRKTSSASFREESPAPWTLARPSGSHMTAPWDSRLAHTPGGVRLKWLVHSLDVRWFPPPSGFI